MSLKDQITEVKQKIAKLEFELAVEKAVLQRLEPPDKTTSNKVSKSPPRRNSLALQAQAILTESAKPKLSVAELSDELIKRGFAKREDELKLTTFIPSALRRRPDIFISTERGFYGLLSRQKEIV